MGKTLKAMALPRTAYPHREHGVTIPDDYDAWEVGTLRDVPGIDPGIVLHVTLLRRAGVATIWSCQGGEGHSDFFPWVEFIGGPGEGLRALGVAIEFNLPARSLSRVWRLRIGEVMGPVWRLEFQTTHAEQC